MEKHRLFVLLGFTSIGHSCVCHQIFPFDYVVLALVFEYFDKFVICFFCAWVGIRSSLGRVEEEVEGKDIPDA